jgi:hypothetical protein
MLRLERKEYLNVIALCHHKVAIDTYRETKTLVMRLGTGGVSGRHYGRDAIAAGL